MSTEKIYVGSGKKHPSYDSVNYSLCLSKLPKEWIYEYEGKKYINLTGAAKKEVDKYGKSHNLTINPYKPDENKQANQSNDNNQDDLPF